MPIIRRKLDPNEVYSTTTRYDEDTDTVQSFVNGSWVDNPQADPRTQTTFPPHITDNTTCDAAQSVSDAFKNQIDGILTLISGSQTAFTIAGAILALFEFGPFGLFIVLALALAHVMLDAGTAALEAALTDTVWHTFTCILQCHMDGSGRVKMGEFPQITADVDSQIGGLAATILDAMLQLAGEGGVNNLASLGTSTGDCTDCEGCDTCSGIGNWIATNSGVTGTIIDRNDHWIEVAADFYAGLGGGYYSDICNQLTLAPNSDDCCTLTFVEVVSGTMDMGAPGGSANHVLCGDGLLSSSPGQGIGDGLIRRTFVGSTLPFTVKYHFSA